MSKVNVILSLVATAVVAFLIGYVVGSHGTPEGESAITAEQAAELPTVAKGVEHCPARGGANPKVTILELIDFQ